MKKVLRILGAFVAIAFLSGGFLVFDRLRKNPEKIVPYPFDFLTKAPAVKPDAPILIVGDRMDT